MRATTGELLGDKTVKVGERGFAAALDWARGLDDERVWALEDCRHVSGAFERFLLVRGERVVRVATRLMAGERRGGRERGKSDLIDALAVARAALREGLERLPGRRAGGRRARHPAARRPPRAARSDARRRSTTTCSGTCTTSGPSRRCRAARCSRRSGPPASVGAWRAPSRRARVRIARDELRQLRELSRTIDALEAEIADLVAEVAPQLLAEPGFGPLTAAKLIGEIAGVERFSSDAKLARAGGIAPIPVSSGKTNRHRLDRGGNRQINTAIHRVAVTRARCHPETRAYIERKRAEGKTNRDAIRCLKRHLARRVWHLLQPPTPDPHSAITINLLT